jgi:hypothetical protein
MSDPNDASGTGHGTRPDGDAQQPAAPGTHHHAESPDEIDARVDPADEPVEAAPEPTRSSRRLLYMIGAVVVALAVVAAFGYFSGLGPLSALSTNRDLEPPDTLGGLHRIADQQTRQALQLDQARDALAQTNKGKTAVEAYGDVGSGSGLFVVLAVRGKIDIDKTVAESGASGDQIRKIGESTCTTLADQVVTCYRGSNTLTVMVRLGTGKGSADRVAPMTDEAFDALK